MTHLGGRDQDLHHENGDHWTTGRNTNGRHLETHEHRIKAHLAEHAMLYRAANLDATFMPADRGNVGPILPGEPEPDNGVTYPSMTTAGVSAFVYIDEHGVAQVSIDYGEGGNLPGWLVRPDGTIPTKVTINGETVFDSGAPKNEHETGEPV